MHSDDAGACRVPSLVSLCQRVAIAHVDSITNLGLEIRFYQVKPVLERCSAEQLFQIEEASPQLQNETHELWMDLCTCKYPKMAQRYFTGEEDDPETWKERYFAMQEAEAKRLEELGCRLRSQRQEAEERKKEGKIKITDRLPPPKRPKTGWGAPQPKSLFQKTRSEASKIQKTVYSARMLPPMPITKDYTLTATKPAPMPPVIQMNGQASRVTVSTVKRPLRSPAGTVPHGPPSATKPLPASTLAQTPPESATQQSEPLPTGNSTIKPLQPQPSQATGSPLPADFQPSRPHNKSPKKDPMACLFLPKHRASSQRPTRV
ncbi:hypothetical protein AX15_006257 [Amanita polypyramis BW_CC]|nr:hypothetical protein AX15_006257 [Amanita polypyramis BW_CC]